LIYAAAGLLLIGVLLRGNPKTTWPGYAIVVAGVPVYYLWRLRRREAVK
jgi:Flp pilus assembly protein TadB